MYLLKPFPALFIVSFILSSANICLSQTINVQGRIVDEENNPLPLVHLRFEGTRIGTVSNDNGEFKIICTLEIIGKRLIVSSMGYVTKKMIVSEGFNKIILTEDITQLQAITLFSRDHGRELVEKAIKAIPNNYSREKERHRVFLGRSQIGTKIRTNPSILRKEYLNPLKKPMTENNVPGM